MISCNRSGKKLCSLAALFAPLLLCYFAQESSRGGKQRGIGERSVRQAGWLAVQVCQHQTSGCVLLLLLFLFLFFFLLLDSGTKEQRRPANSPLLFITAGQAGRQPLPVLCASDDDDYGDSESTRMSCKGEPSAHVLPASLHAPVRSVHAAARSLVRICVRLCLWLASCLPYWLLQPKRKCRHSKAGMTRR